MKKYKHDSVIIKLVSMISNRLLFIFAFVFTSPLLSTESLIFNRPADTAQSRYVIELISQAYQQSGYQLSLVDFPRERALTAANTGELDGQLARVIDIEKTYNNLLRVPTALFSFQLLLIHKKTQCDPCQINDFNKISIVPTYPAANNFLEQHGFLGEIVEVTSIKSQLTLLNQELTDAILVLDFHLQAEVGTLPANRYKVQPVNNTSSYHYIHNSHPELHQRISSLLKQYESNGTLNALKAKHQVK
ncbi:transporter substrate-binding domain-containing protein [Pseudoalteromonas ulvae]|uniref:transporter substrate-binding domain-containing protein n=1 Tax=Pseudoalteromonas ulvae TaxID=107327 RepID=UPI00186B65CC|nr:transporter substrate-binding domain-containing protein [Pseudoalteromonas ulvae]